MKSLSALILSLALALGMLTAGCSSARTPEQKATQARADSLAHVVAVACIDSMDFLVPASQIQVNHRAMHFSPNEMINFVCADRGECIIQLASMSNPRPGINGLGGITIKGRMRLLNHNVDKRGLHVWEFSISSAVTAVRMVMSLPKGSTRVNIRLNGNFRAGDLTIVGNVQPFDPAVITVGRYI